MNNMYLQPESSRIEIGAGAAVSVHVSIGTTLQCLRGSIWLTQEGDSRDHAVPAGTTFCVDTPGRAVLTAIDGASVVRVTPPAPGTQSAAVPGRLSIDSMDLLVSTARTAQAVYVRRALSSAAEWVLAHARRRRLN